MTHFNPPDQKIFFSKNDPDDPRLGELVTTTLNPTTIHSGDFAVLGYPDDEGILLNGGRAGAATAPDTIRRFLYKMTPPESLNQPVIYDLGNLTTDISLPERHSQALATVKELQKKSARTVSFGGGHDYGFPDCAGFVQAFVEQKPLVINFDAHLDVRPTDQGYNSGTPFYRLLDQFHQKIQFVEIGLQPHCNSSVHRKWASERGAHLYNLNTVDTRETLLALLNQKPFQQLKSETPVFISFDIDCLKSSEAPGCSQSWATGLSVSDYLCFFHKLKKMCQLRGLGLYEVSPPLDIENITSKTAAQIAYHFLFQEQL